MSRRLDGGSQVVEAPALPAPERMGYETEYVIVAGVAWIRRSRVETSNGAVADTVWAVTFDDGVPTARRAPAGLRYVDTDESHLWCYHSERGHLRGAGVEFDDAALEIAVREPIAGWRTEA